MKKLLITILAFSLLAGVSISANATVGVVGVMGDWSCGQWVKARNSGGYGNEGNWVLGFISGLAMATKKDFLKGTDNPSIFLWVDNYCHANPFNDVADAGRALATELIKKNHL
jgi:hypothetical protein